MTYNELQDIFQTPFLNSWEHDYYSAVFENELSSQEFLDKAYEQIPSLGGLWFYTLGNTVYFIVPKGTVIPEDFSLSISSITDVPEQPIETPEQ